LEVLGALHLWSGVQCSTGYKVYHKIESQEEAATEETSELGKVFEDTVPCHTYSYSVATMVGHQESTPSEWVDIEIPPMTSALPKITVLTKENNNVTLQVDPPTKHERCEIDQYELQYSADGANFKKTVITKEELGQNSEIELAFVGASSDAAIIKAKVHYVQTGEWSDEFTYGGQKPGAGRMLGDNLTNNTKLPLIPIIVGVAVLALVVIVVTVLLLKRRSNRSSFDSEKAENHNGRNGSSNNHHHNLANSDEETQKLNAEVVT
jgi:hypothetical protein